MFLNHRKISSRKLGFGACSLTLLAAATSHAQLVNPNSGTQWATTWSDEFNTGASDLTGWSYDVGAGGWGNSEAEYYTAPGGTTLTQSGLGYIGTPTTGTNTNNVFVSTDTTTGIGALHIDAIGTKSGNTVNYTSGRIQTQGATSTLFAQTYGLVEIRAKMPAGSGTWPAMWMMPKNSVYGSWPNSGEIDIFEGKGQTPGAAQSTLHSGHASDQDNAQAGTYSPAGFSTSDWHTYDFKWDPGSGTGAGTLSFYVDGALYHTVHGGWTIPTGKTASAPFDQQFYLILNQAIGGNFVGGLTPGAGTYDMSVDYIRAYSSLTGTTTPTWNKDGDGTWSGYTAWQNSVVPNAVDSTAQFAGAISAARTVTIDTPVTTGHLIFNNANSYTLAGTQTLTMSTLSGTAATSIDVQAGSHAINAPLSVQRNLNVYVADGSTLSVGNFQPLSTITLAQNGAGTLAVNKMALATVNANAGTIQVTSNGTSAATSKVTNLNFNGGSVDLVNNRMIVSATGTSRATLEANIVSARNGGAWNGVGLTSSAAANDSTHATTLATFSGSEYHTLYGATATFDGQNVNPNDTLVQYTYYGDATLDGQVNFDDYSSIDKGFVQGLTGWVNGDFDLNGSVNFDDYVLIDRAFVSQDGVLPSALALLSGNSLINPNSNPALAMVEAHYQEFGAEYAESFVSGTPEPTSAAGALLLAWPLLKRRRR